MTHASHSTWGAESSHTNFREVVRPFPASGKHVAVEGANFLTFDKAGRIIGEDWYYDQLSMMIQLGHMEAPGPNEALLVSHAITRPRPTGANRRARP